MKKYIFTGITAMASVIMAVMFVMKKYKKTYHVVQVRYRD